MRARFDGVDVALFAGFTAQAPVSRHDGGGPLVPARVRVVALHHDPWEVGKNQAVEAGVLGDVKRNLAALADALRRMTRGERSAIDERARAIRAAAADRATKLTVRAENARREGTLSAAFVASELAQALPPRAVMVDEAISNREAFVSFLKFGDPLAYWGAKGLSLGHSTGAALGIKLAVCPLRRLLWDVNFLGPRLNRLARHARPPHRLGHAAHELGAGAVQRPRVLRRLLAQRAEQLVERLVGRRAQR